MPATPDNPSPVLLHICCAPCAVACVDSLREEGYAPTGFWYNPNIHPFAEYRSRKSALEDYSQSIGLPLIMRDEYGLRPFVQAVSREIDARCAYCYDVRMRAAASHAAHSGFPFFTSTLLISPYQSHTLLIESAERAAAAFGVAFLYCDFRPLFRAGQQEAREHGMYMQKYCGCIFSEEERYRKAHK